jgi:flagellar motility protein MotE (MotC chaperone)
MNRLIAEFRLVPVVLFATSSLLLLKLLGLAVGGGSIAGGPRDAQAEPNALRALQRGAGAPASISARDGVTAAGRDRAGSAQEMLKPLDYTGSIAKAAEADGKPALPAGPDANRMKDSGAGPMPLPASKSSNELPPMPLDLARPIPTAGERAVLESLQQRRQELDARARELEVRENLMNATEKRLEARIQELKALEGRIAAAAQKRKETDEARLKGIVTMYENMKAKDAAKIFDRLDLKVLLEVAAQINPRRMSDILAQMAPEAAERLTVELAARTKPDGTGQMMNELPKIEGRPDGT